jgi:hypothetical protein
MAAEPFSWNVVVVGSWNVAILSPDGIRRRLFDLPDGTPIELEVAVDRPGHFRIGHGGMIVVPTSSRLEILPRIPDSDRLGRACELAKRALAGLPETPVSAAGVNIRYRFSELPNALIDCVRAPLDTALSDAGFQVQEATTKRAVAVTPGVVNIQVNQTSNIAGAVEFNFHRDSVVPAELGEWMDRVQEFVEMSRHLLTVIGAANA